jgi:hypothetical protein
MYEISKVTAPSDLRMKRFVGGAKKSGSAQESDEGCILGGFLQNDDFSASGRPNTRFRRKMGRIRCFAVEMARRGRSGGIANLRFLVRPRRLETRTERGFPHFHSNGGYCSLAHLKRQALQNRGVRQILAQNQKSTMFELYAEHFTKVFRTNICTSTENPNVIDRSSHLQ